jgi:hypothetical protein
LTIHGKDLGVLKGKTTRKKTENTPVQIFDKPQPKNITLSVDIMYFTGMTFLTTVSRNIRFLTATFLINRKKKVVMDSIQQVMKVYGSKGHNVKGMQFIDNEETPIHTIIADNEFQALRNDIEELGINVHVILKNEHAPEIEHQNRVIKERARAIVQTLPYDK